MSCNNNPAGSPITFDIQYFLSNQCFGCTDNGCPAIINSLCVNYLGPNLGCSGIETNDTIETALQKIDEQICSAIGDYSNYQFHCLTAWYGQAITQESQFVDAITAYACELTSTLEEFTGVTFPAFQSDVTARFTEVNSPSITCSAAGVTAFDDLNTILAKYCNKFGEIEGELSFDDVVWNNCLSVVSTPTTIEEAFILIEDQICQVAAMSSGALPTFNNIGSCLPSPGSADSLVSTIGKIKTRLCQSPTWDSADVTWGCVTAPSSSTDLAEAIQNIVTATTTSLQALPTFDGGDFIVTATNPMDPCAGVTVALAIPLNQDRFVASNSLDGSPGTLADKLLAGTNVTLDFLSSPGNCIIAAASVALDYKVKADTTDTLPDFLDNKVNGGSDTGITIATSYNSGTKQVDIVPQIDAVALFDLLLDQLIPGSDLYNKFCSKVATCPCTCDSGDCTQYLVTLSDSAGTVTWTDCVSGSASSIDLPCNGSVTVCARTGTVNVSLFDVCGPSPGRIILPIQSCSEGTTTTTTSTTLP